MQYKSPLRIFLTLLFLLLSKVQAEPFKVGVILPLSGPAAMYGGACVNAKTLFKLDRPDTNIEVIVEDSRFEAPIAISAYNKLMTNDKVDIIYVWGAGPAAAVAPIAEIKKHPIVLMTGDSRDIRNRKFAISFVNHLREFSLKLLEELRRRNKKKVAIVKTEIQFFETLIDEMKNNLNADESIEIIESFVPGQNVNFQSAITKIRQSQMNKKYDALGVMLMSGQLSSFYKKMSEQKLKIDTFTTHFLESKTERAQSGSSITGAFYSAVNAEDSFVNKYNDKFKATDQVGFAAEFYDFLTLVDDLFGEDYNSNKKLSPEEILEKIESVKETDGVTGKYYFTRDNPEGDPVGGKRFKFPIVIKEVTEGGGEKVIK
jgi:ABC-type branched-subunit amino acid transport system substrate-binding protein